MYCHKFFRMARTMQAALTCGADVEHLKDLGRRYWLVLSCPVASVGGNVAAPLLDTDHDGRVQIPEVLAAIEWLKPRLSSFEVLFTAAEGLVADDICADTAEGAVLRKLFDSLSGGKMISSADLTTAIGAFQAGAANGDGVIPVSAVDTKFALLAEAMLAVTGGTAGCDGKNGIAAKDVEAFRAAREAYLKWTADKPEIGESLNGVAPADAVGCVERLTAKVEAFFAAGELLRYNPAAQETFALPTTPEALAEAPLAKLTPEATAIPVSQGVNPAWAKDLAMLGKLLDEESITPVLWEKAKALVAPYSAWATAKPQGADCFAGMDEHLFAMAGEPAVLKTITDAIDADSANAPLAAAFEDLKKLTALRTDLLPFLQNFVNVEALYPPKAKPLFLTGSLYMDERACSLCFPIEKAAAAHAAAATASKCCLVYCTLTRPADKVTRTILAVFTTGTVNNLTVGKRGLFFDLEGKTWEAVVCHVVPNVISLTEAFFTPWRKVGEAITGTLHKFIASKNDAATAALTTKATATTTAVTTGTATPAAAPNNSAMMASVATLGIALSFVASAVAGIASALTQTPLWKTALVVLGFICIVSVPNVILTWIKLRARDLAPILNASDWAINRTIGFTAGLGKFFTQRASYVGKRLICPPMKTAHPVRNTLLIVVIVAAALTAAWWYCCPTSPRNKVEPQAEAPAETTTTAPATEVAPAATAVATEAQ